MRYEKIFSSKNKFFNGPLLITPKIFQDERGFFYESWNQKSFNDILCESISFCQDNHSKSSKGVLRGLHFQTEPVSQGKLIRTTLGVIYDVIVDLRENYPTFGEWAGVELDNIKKNQLWIPKGFAHGFLTLSDFAEVQYKTTNYWSKKYEKTILWNDSKLNIAWPLYKLMGKKLTISSKDMEGKTFEFITKSGFIFS